MTSCLKKSVYVLRNFSKYSQFRRISQSIISMNVADAQPDAQSKTFSPKIEEIANHIAKLNLLEVAELSDLLKKKLNLPDAPVMGFVPSAAEKEVEEAPAEVTQTSFSVKLVKFDDKQKIPLIKEIKTQIENLNLVQAKKFVESAPIIVKENIGKEEADKLKEALSKVGAVIEII